MKEGKKLDLGLTGLDKLFSTELERMESQLPKIYDIPLSEIDDFPGHPYKVKEDEDMDQLVQSIKDNGILTPVTLRRKEDGRYEVVAGHRRKRACELAGIPTLRAEIKDLTRDEAVILMVESNYQRSKILPSEKAFAYPYIPQQRFPMLEPDDGNIRTKGLKTPPEQSFRYAPFLQIDFY